MSEQTEAAQLGAAGAAMETAEQAIGAWVRVWGESANGILAAGLEQLELTRSLQGQAFHLLEQMASWPSAPQDLSQEWLRLVRPTFESAIASCRRMNDEWAGSLFSAAEQLTGSLAREAPASRPANPPAE